MDKKAKSIKHINVKTSDDIIKNISIEKGSLTEDLSNQKVGGLSSVDVTKPGIDKAYGMKKLMEITKTNKQDILFIGDRLQEGGNDYPVVAFGIEGIEISSWQETALVIETILFVL